MEPNAALVATAKAHAAKWGLDPALVCAICDHESSWDPWACRYESGFYAKYVHKMDVPMMEAMHLSTSWGLGQVMGETARELGFKGPFLPQLCDPDTGLEYVCMKLKKCFALNPKVQDALLAYNGGGDATYPDLVLQHIQKYQ